MNASDKMHLLTGSFMYDPRGMALYDSQGKLVDVNKVVADQLSICGKSSFLIHHLFETSFLSDSQKELLRKGCEVKETFPVGFSIMPSAEVSGRLLGYRMIFTNTAQWMQVPDDPDPKAQENAYLMQRMTESVPGTILFVNKEFVIEKTIANDVALGITSDVVGCRIDELPGVVYHTKIARRILYAISNCFDKGEALSRDFAMYRDTGACYYLKVHLVPANNLAIIFLCNQTGMVEAEKENRRLSILLSERHNMMKLALEKSNVTAFSFNSEKQASCDRKHCKRCMQFYGTTNELLERNKHICRAMKMLQAPGNADSFFTFFNYIRDNKLTESKITTQLKAKSGEYRYYEVCAKVQDYDDEGLPKLMIGTLTDVHDQRMYEQSLIRAKEKAESADYMKSAYLANMTHEIRTPLHAIVGFSDLLGVETDPEIRGEYLNVIKSNYEMLSELINDVLDMSKIEANMMTFTPVPLDIRLWMQEVYNMIYLRVAPEVKLMMDHSQPVLIQADKKRLTQVMTNLLTNAIKHTEQGSIRFGYTLEPDTIRFYVTDTGVGIPDDQLAQIFSRYVQVQGAKQGFGLGLTICKGLITRMGGEISVTSEVGVGSTFTFTLPRR